MSTSNLIGQLMAVVVRASNPSVGVQVAQCFAQFDEKVEEYQEFLACCRDLSAGLTDNVASLVCLLNCMYWLYALIACFRCML